MARLFFMLGLGLCLAGCVTPDIQPVDTWHPVTKSASVDAVTTRVKAGDRAYDVRVDCNDRNAARLRLQVSPDTGRPNGGAQANTHASPGTIRFGRDAPREMIWHHAGPTARAEIAADVLARGLAQVFRSHRQITLAGLTPDAKPLRLTFGQGPYEPTVSDFLAGCPPTHDLMPTLVRIRSATLKPAPKTLHQPNFLKNPPPRYPPEAVEKRETGEVKLVMALTPEGRVLWPEVVQSSGYAALDRASLTAVSQWRFPKQTLGPNALYIHRQTLKFDMPAHHHFSK